MNEFENRIKNEFDKIELPQSDLTDKIMGSLDKKTKNNLIFLRRYVACAVLIIVCFTGAAAVYAGVNDTDMLTLIGKIFKGNISSEILDTISCEAKLLNEKNTFSDVEVTPVRVVGDSRCIYILLEVCGGEADAEFSQYDIMYDGYSNASVSLYNLERKDNTSYFAIEYMGDGIDHLIADAGEINLVLGNYGSSQGSYKAVIAYEYDHKEKIFEKNGVNIAVSALSVICTTENEDVYNQMTNSNINVIIDNNEIETEFCYSSETENDYRIVYSLTAPIEPEQITDVKVVD